MADRVPGDSAAEAWTLLSQVMNARRGHMLRVAAAHELSPPQMWSLRYLEPGVPLPMSALADRLHCDNSNVTGIVDRLEARDLVERQPATHDRRVKHLLLTEEGTRIRQEVGEQMGQTPEGFARLTSGEQRRLVTLLRKLAG